MVFIVKMFAGKPGSPDFRSFSCHGEVWNQALEIARNNGWEPLGTVAPEWVEGYSTKPGLFQPDYAVEDIRWAKEILPQDAFNIAQALENYLSNFKGKLNTKSQFKGPILLVDGMSEEEYKRLNQGITGDFLRAFIAFLRKGGFGFCWDD